MYTVYLYHNHIKEPQEYVGFNTLKEATNFCKINHSLIDTIELYKIINEEEVLCYNSNLYEIKLHSFMILNKRRIMEIILGG